jgi:hypothetical protein
MTVAEARSSFGVMMNPDSTAVVAVGDGNSRQAESVIRHMSTHGDDMADIITQES